MGFTEERRTETGYFMGNFIDRKTERCDNQNWRCSDAREDKINENVMAYAQYEKNGGRFSQVRVATSTEDSEHLEE